MTTIFEAKWWIPSRTLWFNVFVLGFAAVEQFVPIIEQYAPSAQWLLSGVAVGNIILRIMTQAKLAAQTK